MTLHEKLRDVQSQLKAPKGEWNDFGKYPYRSCEGILEALKPLLADVGMSVTLSDSIVWVEGRHYIQATATVTDVETREELSVTALARESENKKGMDASQLTGATSSYARKYALSGMFAIDDNKDSDATNEERQGVTKATYEKPVPAKMPKDTPDEIADMRKTVCKMAEAKGMSPEMLVKGVQKYFPGTKSLEALDAKQLSTLMDKISQMAEAKPNDK